jgi:hypothetical protein
MSPTLTAVPDTASAEFADFEQRMALIACGTREGKTQACDSHRKKGATLLRIASTGAADALAMAICGSEHRRSCTACVDKADQIIGVYNEGTE